MNTKDFEINPKFASLMGMTFSKKEELEIAKDFEINPKFARLVGMTFSKDDILDLLWFVMNRQDESCIRGAHGQED